MTIKAKFSLASVFFIFVASVFLASLYYFIFALHDSGQFVLQQYIQYLIWSFILALILSIIFTFFNNMSQLSILDGYLIYKSATTRKKINISRIKSINFVMKYIRARVHLSNTSFPTPRTIIKSEDEEICFISQNFKNSELNELYKELINKNPSIKIDSYTKAFMNNKSTKRQYYKELFRSRKVWLFTFIIIIFLLIKILGIIVDIFLKR